MILCRYKVVTQNTQHLLDNKNNNFIFASDVDLNKCLKQIKLIPNSLFTCARKLPSNMKAMADIVKNPRSDNSIQK